MIVGIDLGTTNSLIAYYTEDGAKIIPNRLGKNLTPSVVSVDEEGQIYVGETAKEREILYPGSSASVFKRDMGSNKKFHLGKKHFVENGIEYEKDFEFSAQELSALVLKALKEDAEHYLGVPVEEAVISVPAYFNEERRRATKLAGEMAGFKVERIISEPTAAAVAYGLYEKDKDEKFLVFDLGGGTLDVSILEMIGDILEVHSVSGDNFLGGEDFTDILVDMFFEEHPEFDRQLLDDKTICHIKKKAEECKRGMDDNEKNIMHCVIDGESVDFEVNERKYEIKCAKLFDRIKVPLKQSINDAGIKISDLDKVVLIGGATKMNMIRRFVAKIFKKIPDCSINPDEAVALGAAIQGAMKERNKAVKELILTDVCPFTLGTEVTIDREDGSKEGGHYHPIIERNTVIPASRTDRFYTSYDNQKKLCVDVLQGESRFAKNNLYLGEITVNVPPDKAGREGIDVTYTYDINSLLEVQVRVLSTGEVKKQVFKNQSVDMTDEEIKKRFEEISFLKIHPRDQEENRLLIFKGERLYEESLGIERILIESHLREFESALDSRNDSLIKEARKKFMKFLLKYEAKDEEVWKK
ncbi:molecular chaperone HscC [Lachnospiraceae bacterium RM5]|nr:molecular chaperone HscC [Lachnospiraceae bacterium RM5]